MNTPFCTRFNRFAFRVVKRQIAAVWCLLFVLAGASLALADDVQFASGSYSINGNQVTMSMSGIENYSPTTSGTLRIELWAFASPYDAAPGAVGTGFRLAVSPVLGTLNADSYFVTSPITEISYFNPPSHGTYYQTLVLTEYAGSAVDDGFVFDDYVNDVNPTTYGAVSGADFGVSSAVQVGSGYFYDADLGYIYPFFDGWAYFESLNGYFYIDIGTDFVTGVYIFDLSANSWTYTEESFWPYVYFFNGTGWVDTGYN